MMKKPKSGIRTFFIILIFFIFAIVVGLFAIKNFKTSKGENNYQQGENIWIQDGSIWKAQGTPTKCPEPLRLAPFADVNKATSILYPGQMRSAGYEPTAGYRFDGLPNDAITVTIPMDGEVVQAARFLVGGELQYVFDIISPCGIMIRFDHLLTLTPKFEEIATKLPDPKEGDNRSTTVSPRIAVNEGETIATAVGLRKNNNTFLSVTMFDFRQKNNISQDPNWAKEHPILYHYVICPYLYMPQKDYDRIKSLPAADFTSGSHSDFCN